MKIKLKKYGSFDFQPNEELDYWSAVKIIDNTEIDFNFNLWMSRNSETKAIEINWGKIKTLLKQLDGEISPLLEKSKEILDALHIAIFNKSVESINAYFLLDEIQIVGVNSVVNESFDLLIGGGIQYKLGFCLESKDDEMAVLDPYCKYFAYFTGNLVLSGGYRG